MKKSNIPNKANPPIQNKKQYESEITLSPFQQQFQANPSDSKLTAYMKTISELQNSIHILQTQLQYYRNTNQWVQYFVNSKGIMNKQSNSSSIGMKSLMNAATKLNIFEKQAILGFNNKTKPLSHKQLNIKQKNCNISSHLRQILSKNIQTQNKIQQLLQTRQTLYNKIRQTLQKQQPYLHQKIMTKIQREVSKYKKLQTLKHLQMLCKQKQNWLSQAKQQINSQIDQKVIQIKVSANLAKMKQIMNKKINNDQYIGFISNEQNINKNIYKLKKIGQQIKIQLRARMDQLDKRKGGDVEQNLQQKKRQKEAKLKFVELDQTFFNDIQELIKEGEESLSNPLGSQNTQSLLIKCEQLTKQLNLLSNKKF